MSKIIKIYNEDTHQWDSIPAMKGDKGDTGEGVPSGGSTGQILQKKSGTNYDTEWVDKPASATWENVTGKPFASIDSTTLKVENNVLKVNTTDTAAQDNTQPITSSGVHTLVGGINSLLATI